MEQPKTFKDLGVIDPLCEACDTLGYDAPTPIQEQAISAALHGRDLLCMAEPDSGTTVAFVLPILQALMISPQPLHSLILVPTSELVLEVSQVVENLGTAILVRCTVLIEGSDMAMQQTALRQDPHIIVSTPQCMLQHLEHTSGFSLRILKYLVLYGADQLVDLDSGPILDRILAMLPPKATYLFAATISDKVDSLQRSVLSNPIRASVSTEQTASQSYIFTPANQKDFYLVYLLQQRPGQTGLLYTQKRATAQKVMRMLQYIGFHAISIHGQLSDGARLAALNGFWAGSWNLLVLTGAAGQGLRIPSVDFVVHYDLPDGAGDYNRRVGRASVGGGGTVISFVTQYEVEAWLRIENGIGTRVDELEINRDEVMLFDEQVMMAQSVAERALSP
ncbi:hypothetical protein ASPVEDRAFT_190158 [Aspergillus versicolor CBS 583.65]|uniref:RNA helicase n=1 Tax=Aspergillus versicolor CBS 583.65 TaxID=1036611 RepID=A0A1L9PH42_ASPVE|nr:uncharacterized protein ASPVEDRAFT_190158 [Aspergillus versicolor CBS 583.65]OJJ00839.1 hypothetical protein ASPVEDRAFT_190158 [Aspergillus versicolor CBS 583.65]